MKLKYDKRRPIIKGKEGKDYRYGQGKFRVRVRIRVRP